MTALIIPFPLKWNAKLAQVQSILTSSIPASTADGSLNALLREIDRAVASGCVERMGLAALAVDAWEAQSLRA
jgi:hypothetical protein